MIGIIDYGVGNIKAFANIYKSFDLPYKIVSNESDFEGVTKLILPGVGSFDYAMQSLNNSGLREKLDYLVKKERMPVLGICVGMQMLARSSEEGMSEGLNWIPGKVKRFDDSLLDNLPLPHMGWNTLNIVKQEVILDRLDEVPKFYFLHTYYYQCDDEQNVLATAEYGSEFHCIINKDNVFGIQCHPEKSHHNGIQLLKNFGELNA